jgi:phytoene dehydrogenase-like protein
VKKLADAINNKFLQSRGEIKLSTEVIKVNAEKKYITDSEGENYYYKNLVWAADIKTFYNITETGDLSQKLVNEFLSTRKEYSESRGGDSVFTVYIEVDEPIESFREIAHGHFFYTPSKEGLGKIHREELDSIIANYDKLSRSDILEWLDRFTELNTYEISVPGLKDPALVPDGKTGLIISLLTEYDLFKKIEDDGWYKEFKKEFEDRIVKVISDSVYPVLKEKLIRKFSFSPLSIERRVGSSDGAIVGWTFERPVPVVNKIQISDKSVFTPFPDIFQAGQWVYSPAGVPMSILTGRLAADKILKKKD